MRKVCLRLNDATIGKRSVRGGSMLSQCYDEFGLIGSDWAYRKAKGCGARRGSASVRAGCRAAAIDFG